VPLDETWPYSGDPLPSGVVERSGRVWRISKTGTMNGFEVLLRYDQAENADQFNTGVIKLLVHNNSDPQDFSSATVYNASSLQSGNVAKFTNVNLSDGDYFALGNSSSITPLPIELLTFDAKPDNGRVAVDWVTSSEINNDYFVVERAGRDLKFQSIDTVNGAGNSNTHLEYGILDKSPLPGYSYYRLKQLDFDGNAEYSDPVSVVFEIKEGALDFRLFPNPATTGEILKLQRLGDESINEDVHLRLYDLSGKLMYQQKLNAQLRTWNIKVPSFLSKGMYIAVLNSSGRQLSNKLLIE
jgi:hypothetical protein